MKKVLLALLVLGMTSLVWAEVGIQFSFSVYEPEPVGSLQIEPSEAIMDIFTDNDVDVKYLQMDGDYAFVPASVKEDIQTVIVEDTSNVLDKIRAELKSYLEPGKIEYVYMLIGNRLFSATIGER